MTLPLSCKSYKEVWKNIEIGKNFNSSIPKYFLKFALAISDTDIYVSTCALAHLVEQKQWTAIKASHLAEASPFAACQVILSCRDDRVRQGLLGLIPIPYLQFMKLAMLDKDFEIALPPKMRSKRHLEILRLIEPLLEGPFFKSGIVNFLPLDIAKLVYRYLTGVKSFSAIETQINHDFNIEDRLSGPVTPGKHITAKELLREYFRQ